MAVTVTSQFILNHSSLGVWIDPNHSRNHDPKLYLGHVYLSFFFPFQKWHEINKYFFICYFSQKLISHQSGNHVFWERQTTNHRVETFDRQSYHHVRKNRRGQNIKEGRIRDASSHTSIDKPCNQNLLYNHIYIFIPKLFLFEHCHVNQRF